MGCDTGTLRGILRDVVALKAICLRFDPSVKRRNVVISETEMRRILMEKFFFNFQVVENRVSDSR